MMFWLTGVCRSTLSLLKDGAGVPPALDWGA